MSALSGMIFFGAACFSGRQPFPPHQTTSIAMRKPSGFSTTSSGFWDVRDRPDWTTLAVSAIKNSEWQHRCQRRAQIQMRNPGL